MKNNDYLVPDGYFESLEKDIMAKTIDKKTTNKPLILKLIPKKITYITGIAAAITLVFGVYYYEMKVEEQKEAEATQVLYDSFIEDNSTNEYNYTEDIIGL